MNRNLILVLALSMLTGVAHAQERPRGRPPGAGGGGDQQGPQAQPESPRDQGRGDDSGGPPGVPRVVHRPPPPMSAPTPPQDSFGGGAVGRGDGGGRDRQEQQAPPIDSGRGGRGEGGRVGGGGRQDPPAAPPPVFNPGGRGGDGGGRFGGGGRQDPPPAPPIFNPGGRGDGGGRGDDGRFGGGGGRVNPPVIGGGGHVMPPRPPFGGIPGPGHGGGMPGPGGRLRPRHLNPGAMMPNPPSNPRRWGPQFDGRGRPWTPQDWGGVRVDRWNHRFEDINWLNRRYDARNRIWDTRRPLFERIARSWLDDYFATYRVPRYGVGSFVLGTGMLSDDYQDYTTAYVFGSPSVSQIRIVALGDGATLEYLQLKRCYPDQTGNLYIDVPLNRGISGNTTLLEGQSTSWIDIREYTQEYVNTGFRVEYQTVQRPVCIESFSISGYGNRTGFDEFWEQDETQIVLIGLP